MKRIKIYPCPNVELRLHVSEQMEPDYQCPECGFGVADDYVYCPHCGAELDWRHVRMLTERFRKLAERL